MILVLDEKYQNALIQAVLFGRHGVHGVRQHAWLKDGSQILRVHAVFVCLGCENSQEIQNVEQQLSVQGRQLLDELLVLDDSAINVEVVDELRTISITDGGLGCAAKGISELLVQIERYDGLWEVV